MKALVKQYRNEGLSGLIGLFFILVLHFKFSYTLIPFLLALVGIVLAIPALKQRQWQLTLGDKLFIFSVLSYFLLFVASVLLHQGRGKELDIPSRLLLLLPVLVMCYQLALKPVWILYGIVFGTLLAGIVGLVQHFVLHYPILFPAHTIRIQSGDIVMTMSLFSLAIMFYFQRQGDKKGVWLAALAAVLGLTVCLINQARGAWLAAPLVLVIFWLNRKALPKAVVILMLLSTVASGVFLGHFAEKRWSEASQEISLYVEKNDGSTSVGARLDMWKSAVLAIEEKPIFGWGIEGMKALRQQHFAQKQISKFASQFDHAHNQYLQDASARGILGLGALLAIFLVPLVLFWRRSQNEMASLWGTLGVLHVLATMIYCLTQGFLSHNSGIMFYGFVVLLLLGLQKRAQILPQVRSA